MNKSFSKCPCCSSPDRFLEGLANEVKERGIARPEWTACWDVRQGVIVDQTKEAAIPIGSEVPGYQVMTDICCSCGCIYAIELNSYPVKKTVIPPKIAVPGGKISPGFNNPRIS